MYVSPNFKSKKALKDALSAGRTVTVFNPGLGGDPPVNGRVTVEGPHYPEPHKWYGSVELRDGRVVSVK